jgi:hypothetical protein
MKRGKRTRVLTKNFKKNSPQLDTDVKHRAVKKKTVKKKHKTINWHSIENST